MVTNKRYFGTGRISSQSMTPQRDMYARPDSRVEYQLFSSEYFSNADVKVYFGDIWVDDITSIGFTLQEEVMPIYGYNSYTFDTVARGKRIVQGQFSMNFTSVGFLHQVVENANAIFYALESGEKKGIIKPAYYETMTLSEILQKLGKESFEQIADEYEQAIWGSSTDTEEMLNYANMPYFRQDSLGLDIRIQYGAIEESTGYIQNKMYESGRKERPNLTVDVLNGVQLMGMSKQISTQDQGAPIQEIYSFMARDLNGISFAHMKKGSQSGTTSLGTTYRKMQYGPIR